MYIREHTLTYVKYTENAENARRNPRDEDEGVFGKHRQGLRSRPDEGREEDRDVRVFIGN